MKNIFVLYTGGTIGMRPGEHGLEPDPALAQHALAAHAGSLKADWHICEPLIDSSAVSPQHWHDWLQLLRERLPHYDGALVLHGTDTLAYTANLLALALDTGGKAVVLTGSQRPFGTDYSDAPANLALAAQTLATGKAKGVVLAFAGSLFPAVGSSKCSTERDAGFTNHRFGALNPQGADVSGCFLAPPAGSLKREIDPAKRITAVLLLPGSEEAAAHMLNSGGSDGAVILGYGHGNAPAHPALLAAAQGYCAGGRPLLLISQTPDGCAAPVYAQSAPLLAAGALAAGYCNAETAAALLLLAASNGWQRDDILAELQRLQLLPAA